jgi:hypothetical protein
MSLLAAELAEKNAALLKVSVIRTNAIRTYDIVKIGIRIYVTRLIGVSTIATKNI